MKASNYIYKQIIQNVSDNNEDFNLKEGVELSLENSEDIYSSPDEYVDCQYAEDYIYEEMYDFRSSGVEINVSPEKHSRHYEVDYVATEIDGVWIGWHYWHGGGKHGEPESIDWIESSDILDLVSEKQVVTTIREFKRKEEE